MYILDPGSWFYMSKMRNFVLVNKQSFLTVD